jgi:hypothetical protein
MRQNAAIKTAAERAAAEVYEQVRAAAEAAARQAVRDAIREELGVEVEDVDLDDRVTRTEAARRLGTTSQTIIRLENRGAVDPERATDGRVYVSLAEVRAALGDPDAAVQARLERRSSTP